MCRVCSDGCVFGAIFIVVLLNVYSLFALDKYILKCDRNLVELSGRIALEQVSVVERSNNNDGEVEKYLSSVDLSKGNPYCAAGQYWCFWQASKLLGLPTKSIPIPRTGLASNIYKYATKQNMKAKYLPSIHDLIVWKKGQSIFGHIERIVGVKQAGWVITVAFNTLDSKSGKEGVFIKKRNIYTPLHSMAIRGLIGFDTK